MRVYKVMKTFNQWMEGPIPRTKAGQQPGFPHKQFKADVGAWEKETDTPGANEVGDAAWHLNAALVTLGKLRSIAPDNQQIDTLEIHIEVAYKMAIALKSSFPKRRRSPVAGDYTPNTKDYSGPEWA